MFLLMAHRACEEVAWTPRTLAWSAVVAFLFASVRPDALLILLAFLGILGVVVVTSMMAPRVSARLFPAVNAKGYVRLLASSVVAVAALEITRLAVFGELMPQPVNAKSGFRFALSDGWSYVRESLPPAWIAIPLAVLLGAGVSRVLATKSLMGWMSVTVAGGWLALVIGSGGDWMGMGRLLVSFYVLSLVLCAVGLVWGCEVVARVVAKTSRDVARKMAVATIGCGVLAAEITACVFLATNPGYFNSNLRTYLPISSEWSAFEGVTGSLQERSLPSDVPWYQRRNSSHLRDELFRRQLEPWLGEFLRTHPRDEPYTIGSVQAGMVPYYVFLKFPGKIRFIDMASLSTKDFSKCDDLEKSRFGTVIWVWQWRKWAGQCAPPLPDMFFGHGESDKNTIGEGYDIVVSQDLTLKWSDKTTFASLIFAVRQELLTE
jgi:hypothetical protein